MGRENGRCRPFPALTGSQIPHSVKPVRIVDFV